VVILDHLRVDALAQASIRTVVPSNQPFVTRHLPSGLTVDETLAMKLALGIKVSSALRTVTPKTCYQGPGLTSIFRKLEAMVPHHRLLIWPETASAWSSHEDEDIAKHLSCVMRLEHVPKGEMVIVVAALVEEDPISLTSRCEVAFGLKTLQDRLRFLTAYSDQLFAAFLPSILQAGFAFEAHPQNVLLRIRPASQGSSFLLSDDWECAGFAVRDFGGIKVHRDKLRAAIHEELDVFPEACTVAESMDDVYKLAYHTLIFCHLHVLARSLRLHHSGDAWKVIRRAFRTHCPKESELYRKWMQHGWIEMKSFLRMKLDGLYRDYLYDPSPNLMLYQSEIWSEANRWWASDEVVSEGEIDV